MEYSGMGLSHLGSSEAQINILNWNRDDYKHHKKINIL